MYTLILAVLLGIPVAHSYSIEDLEYLTEAIYFEARGESIQGQEAVAHVILNRVSDKRWPSTIKGVIIQRLQFSYRNGKAEDLMVGKSKRQWALAELIAHRALTGSKDPTDGATHYLRIEHSTDLSWYKKLEVTIKIGHHTFLR